MPYKFLLLILVFYLLSLFQESFLPHFSISGVTPNLVLILVCLLTFFEERHKHYGLFWVLIAGFFLDIFSKSYFGLSIFSLLLIYFFIKKSLRLLKEIPKNYSVIYFILLVVLSVVIYELLWGMFNWPLGRALLNFGGSTMIIKVIYNLAIGLIGFYLFKRFSILRP